MERAERATRGIPKRGPSPSRAASFIRPFQRARRASAVVFLCLLLPQKNSSRVSCVKEANDGRAATEIHHFNPFRASVPLSRSISMLLYPLGREKESLFSFIPPP